MAINPWPYQPLEVIGIEYIAELPNTSRGYNYILDIQNHFSKFNKFYADRTTKIDRKYFTESFLVCNIPLELLSEQEPSYESELFQ